MGVLFGIEKALKPPRGDPRIEEGLRMLPPEEGGWVPFADDAPPLLRPSAEAPLLEELLVGVVEVEVPEEDDVDGVGGGVVEFGVGGCCGRRGVGGVREHGPPVSQPLHRRQRPSDTVKKTQLLVYFLGIKYIVKYTLKYTLKYTPIHQ